MRKVITSILLLSATAGAWAGTPWSLRQCIDYALENNITVKQNELNVMQNEIELNTAKNSRLPGASAQVSEQFNFGRGLNADNIYANT